MLAEGVDPDPRFTLANERTYLAWIRTALGLLAAGVGLEALGAELLGGWRRPVASLVIALGGVVSTVAFGRWVAVERAMRREEGIPLPVGAWALSVSLGVVALVLFVAVVF